MGNIAKYMGLCVYRRSYLIWSAVIVVIRTKCGVVSKHTGKPDFFGPSGVLILHITITTLYVLLCPRSAINTTNTINTQGAGSGVSSH